MQWRNWDNYDTFFTILFVLAGAYFFVMLAQSADTFSIILPVLIQLMVGIAWIVKYLRTRDHQP